MRVIQKDIYMKSNIHFDTSRIKNHYLVSILSFLFLFALTGQAKTVSAKSYVLAIQPILSKERTIKFYQPLAAFLSKVTGHEIKIYATSNFVTYWEELRQNKNYDLVLDAAHFADYRVKHLKYTVLAKINDTVSYSLVTNENVNYFDAEELIGQRIATLASPSIDGVRLLNIYPNISRQPVIIGTNNFQETLQKLKSNKVSAALIPTPLISGDSTVNTIMVTDPVPHMAISASNLVNQETQEKIRKALIKASSTKEGQALFSKLNLTGFEKASNSLYDGYRLLLKDVWGY